MTQYFSSSAQSDTGSSPIPTGSNIVTPTTVRHSLPTAACHPQTVKTNGQPYRTGRVMVTLSVPEVHHTNSPLRIVSPVYNGSNYLRRRGRPVQYTGKVRRHWIRCVLCYHDTKGGLW